MSLNSVIIGKGPQLIACAKLWIDRGHRIATVVSDCPEVTAWTQRDGIKRLGTQEDWASQLEQEAFDLFFSIVNHSITPPNVLALPRLGAINFHDSPLPAYGGFNATSWSILDGRTEHGITWHWMTADVDGGGVLVQKVFPITEDDTAFTLASTAAEMAVRSFSELVQMLEQGEIPASVPSAVLDFHFKSERPSPSLLDWNQPLASLLRLVRGLDFGNEDNWMTRAKVQLPNGEILVVGRATKDALPMSSPGGILDVTEEGIKVSVSDGCIYLEDLQTIDGDVLSSADFLKLGIRRGDTLPEASLDLSQTARVLDAEVTKNERYWLKKLVKLAPPDLLELNFHANSGDTAQVLASLPEAFTALTNQAQLARLVACVAAYVVRIGGNGVRVSLGLQADDFPADLRTQYAVVVPLTLDIVLTAPFLHLDNLAKQEIDECVKRKTYARDIRCRYGELRGKSTAGAHLPITIGKIGGGNASLPIGSSLLITVLPESKELGLLFDTGAMTSVQAERLATRLTHLFEMAATSQDLPLASLNVVPHSERNLLLQVFNEPTSEKVEVECIHTLFAKQASLTPEKPALAFRDESLTYRELDERSNILAHRLQRLGVGPDQMVAISVERSIHMVIGLLAVLKAGGAYVPLDPAYPAERLSIMLEDSGARWLLTQNHLVDQLPKHQAEVVLIDSRISREANSGAPTSAVTPDNLAYVIFTSGSTGRPKGVMVEHKNVANFFAGMDTQVGRTPGIWLAVTSISFDISVLEIWWSLTRGFEVVIQEEGDRASLLKKQGPTTASNRRMDFGLFYFAADSTNAATSHAYRLLLEGARFADQNGFVAVWTPERHFHAFGGLYPNPAVTSAALASITSRIQLRAGSVVIPLHDPIRVAEDWAVVDNLSQGRVGLSFASGWHVNDFALKPENYERRREVMQESIDTVLKLWAGEKIKVKNGLGETIEVAVMPRPVRERPPMWIASAGNIDTFKAAGRSGYNILTNMLGQDIKDLGAKFAAYREARRDSGHADDGIISVMLHTFITDDDEKSRELARKPFGNYLSSSYDLVKVAPWMFPAFKQPSTSHSGVSAFDSTRFDADDMAALLDHAFDRYFDTAGLFGTPERALNLIEQLKDIGATEVACLVDFGIDPDVVLENLVHLDKLRQLSNPGIQVESVALAPISIREQFERRPITHFQCTPSLARILEAEGVVPHMTSLRKFLLGGEALSPSLAQTLTRQLPNTAFLNMYGPTETTVWSTSALVEKNDSPITIGKPIVNTQIRLMDSALNLVPIGTAGEICIGGAGVVRGYLYRPDLTEEKFVGDPIVPGNRLYRTGDLARYREDGLLEYIGRIDHQVKVNGYRIELGEIEAILGKHPAIKEAIVAVMDGAAGPELTGYVIARASGGQSSAALNDVANWKDRWDKAYSSRLGASDGPVRFDTSGWLDSYSGEPIPALEMREWLDQTVKRILSLSPKRVLEIGCGTGMILYSCLPHVEHYTAVDLSPHALESIRCELSSIERSKVRLLNCSAHELASIGSGDYDLVIINSVAQYFPTSKYLTEVIRQAASVLIDRGHIFIGDIRSLEEQTAFSTLVELQKAPGQLPANDLSGRITERMEMDPELLLSAAFFSSIAANIPDISLKSITLKQGDLSNEMRDFRFDVVMQTKAVEPELREDEIPGIVNPAGVEVVAEALAKMPPLLLITGIENARLERIHRLRALMERGSTELTVDALRSKLDTASVGTDPNTYFDLSSKYDAEIRFGKLPGTFDVLFRNRLNAPKGIWPASSATAHTRLSSNPRIILDFDSLAPKLKTHLKGYLPEYMVPQTFVSMESFPLTPNGKIDRKSLPKPEMGKRKAKTQYATPGTELERTISKIWSDLLGIERVGRKDNIFDLGASSILTVEANNRLQNELGRKVPLVTMFRFPTIEALAAHLSKTLLPQNQADSPPSAEPSIEQERQNRIEAAAARRRKARAQS